MLYIHWALGVVEIQLAGVALWGRPEIVDHTKQDRKFIS